MSNLTVKELVARAKAAQAVYETFSQAQVDEISLALCKVEFDNAVEFSKRAYEETKMGIFEQKISKHVLTSAHCANFIRDKKSVGLIEDNKELMIKTYAKPVGVVASLTPSTNPTTTACLNAIYAVKSGNAIIVAPHPRAKGATKYCVDLMNAKVMELGGPANLVQCIEEPTIESTDELMTACDVVIATGGPAMVRAAYSSGKPSYGVGAGNVQAIFGTKFTEDEIDASVGGIVFNRALDNGMLCSGEQTVFVPRDKADRIIGSFEAQNAFIIKDEAKLREIKDEIFVNDRINAAFAGRTAVDIAAHFNIEVPEGTQILMAKLDKHAEEELLSREILFPFVRYMMYDTFEEAVQMAKENLLLEGAGHTACIYSYDDNEINYAGVNLPVGRVCINQFGGAGGGNTEFNALPPTISLGCGSWGGNSISENLNFNHLMNKTHVAYRLPGVEAMAPEDYAKVFIGIK